MSKNDKASLLNKARLYDGEEVDGFTQKDIPALKKEFEAEGMVGISPRYVINRIFSTLSEENTSDITPIDVIRSLRAGFESNPKLNKKEMDRLDDILTIVIEEYSKIAKNEVQKAFFVNFEKEVDNLLKNYLDHVEADLDGTKVEDEWGEMHDPNERLMRSIEEKIKISQSGRKSFRQEIFRKMLKSAKNNGDYNYKEHPKLKEALETEMVHPSPPEPWTPRRLLSTIQKTVKIGTWNIQGMMVIGKLRNIQQHMEKYQIDVLLLQETYCQGSAQYKSRGYVLNNTIRINPGWRKRIRRSGNNTITQSSKSPQVDKSHIKQNDDYTATGKRITNKHSKPIRPPTHGE